MGPVSATFMFADIAGFTALTEAHGDEQAAALVAEFCEAIGRELPATGGTHVKTIGDAVMLTIPEPADAILLGLRITNDLMFKHGAPAIRVALHHGTAVEQQGDFFGASVNPAARVSAEASGGDVIITGPTAALAPDLEGVVYESRADGSCEMCVIRSNCSRPYASARRAEGSCRGIPFAGWRWIPNVR
jgi:adenylate cyclase